MAKNELFNTPSVKVVWANIADPDEYRGTIKHQIQVQVTPELQELLDEKSGGSDINGLRQDNEGNTILKAKSSVYTKEGEVRFGRVFDATGKDTEVNPYKNDTVRLRLSPFKLDNGSVSFFLNAVQIVEKLEYVGSDGGGGFDAVEGGFDFSTPNVTEDDETTGEPDMPF
jgi:hypothetical protein